MGSGTAMSEILIDGDRASLLIGPLTRTDFVRFAGVSGDFNPVHHDELYARSLGYPSVFAMGMLTASLAARLLSSWFGLSSLRAYSARFLAPVWPHETLTVSGQIVERHRAALASIDLIVVNQSGERKITGTAMVAIDH